MSGSKVVFLLGSGISLAAGYPCAKKLTKEILDTSRSVKHANQSFCRIADKVCNDAGWVSASVFDPIINAIIELIKENNRTLVGSENREITYEDIQNVILLLCDYYSGELDNPVLLPLSKQILPILGGLQGNDFQGQAAGAVFEGLKWYITDTCASFLRIQNPEHEYLKWLSDAAIDNNIKQVNYCTLNHDTLLERHFLEAKLDFIDGFVNEESTSGIRYDDLEVFNRFPDTPRLLKLHGSINWYSLLCDEPNDDTQGAIISCDKDGALHRLPEDSSAIQFQVTPHPRLLIGTHHKMFRYQAGFFRYLHYQFAKILESSNALIVCGYGFADKGITNQIIDWFNFSKQRTLVIIDPNKDRLLSSLAHYYKCVIGRGMKERSVIFVEKKAEEVQWEELKALIL